MKKHLLIAFLLCGLLAWTQTATQNSTPANPDAGKPAATDAAKACSCCAKIMAQDTGSMPKTASCCARTKDGAKTCCSDKDVKACARDAKCTGGDCCKGSGAAACKGMEKSNAKCCGNQSQCCRDKKA